MKDILKEKKTETFTVLKNYEGKRRKKNTLCNISVVLINNNNEGFKLQKTCLSFVILPVSLRLIYWPVFGIHTK